jgi:sugar phosphate permease
MITGVIRTTVVFWMPTYLSDYLEFTPDNAALIFTVATFIISLTTFIVIFIYEKLGHNMDLTILITFISSSVMFALLYFVRIPVLNIALLVLAIMSSNGAATMLWSRYCPSLRDTGMVSSVTGFLDFVSYMSASFSSTLFANAVSGIGWGNLILVWCGLVVCGVIVALPYGRIFKREKNI